MYYGGRGYPYWLKKKLPLRPLHITRTPFHPDFYRHNFMFWRFNLR